MESRKTLESDLGALRSIDLKIVLKMLRVSTTGTKAVLIEKVIKELDDGVHAREVLIGSLVDKLKERHANGNWSPALDLQLYERHPSEIESYATFATSIDQPPPPSIAPPYYPPPPPQTTTPVNEETQSSIAFVDSLIARSRQNSSNTSTAAQKLNEFNSSKPFENIQGEEKIGKNTEDLLNSFERYRQQRASSSTDDEAQPGTKRIHIEENDEPADTQRHTVSSQPSSPSRTIHDHRLDKPSFGISGFGSTHAHFNPSTTGALPSFAPRLSRFDSSLAGTHSDTRPQFISIPASLDAMTHAPTQKVVVRNGVELKPLTQGLELKATQSASGADSALERERQRLREDVMRSMKPIASAEPISPFADLLRSALGPPSTVTDTVLVPTAPILPRPSQTIQTLFKPKPPVVESEASLKFKKLPFYTIQRQLGKDSYFDCSTAKFHQVVALTQDIVKRVSDSSDLRIYLFMHASKSSEARKQCEYPVFYTDSTTSFFSITVNDREAPAKKYMGLKKRMDTCKPLDITPYLRMVAEKTNTISMKCTPKKITYIASFQLVKVHSVSSLISELQRDKFVTESTILKQYKIRMSEVDEVVSTLDTISMNDPVSLCRINLPARSSQCRHTQCFDLETFLEMNLDIPQWRCGVCNKPTPYEDLIIDGFFASILRKVDEDTEKVDINLDGSWKVWMDVAVDEVKAEERKKARAANQRTPRESNAASDSGVVDLTLDSE